MASQYGNEISIIGSDNITPIFSFDGSMIDVENLNILPQYQDTVYSGHITSTVEVDGVKCKVAGTDSFLATSDGTFNLNAIFSDSIYSESTIILFVKLIDFPKHSFTMSNNELGDLIIRSKTFRLFQIGESSNTLTFGGCVPFYKNMKTDEINKYDYSKISLGVSRNFGSDSISLMSDFVYNPNEWYMLGMRNYYGNINFSINGVTIYTTKSNNIPWKRLRFRKYFSTLMRICSADYINKKKLEMNRLNGYKNHNGEKIVANKNHKSSITSDILPNFRFGMCNTGNRRGSYRQWQSLSQYGHYKVYNNYLSDEALLNVYNSLKNDY